MPKIAMVPCHNPYKRGGPDEQTEDIFPILHSTLQGEWAKLERKIKESKLSQKDYFTRCTDSFNKELEGREGQLIVALTRRFSQNDFCSDPSVHLGLANLEEEVQIGLITNKTKVGASDNLLMHSPFVKNVEKAHHLGGNGLWAEAYTNAFTEKENVLFLLAFHDEPPKGTPDYNSGGCFGGNVQTYTPTKKPRLEFFIGDEKAMHFMQSNLKGYQYQLASNFLGRDLPLSEELEDKIKKEQVDLFEGIRAHEKDFLLKNAKYNLLRDTAKSGAVPEVDEVAIILNKSPAVNSSKEDLLHLVRIAKSRKYDLYGIETRVDVEEGVVLDLNLKTYFSSRINKYL